MSHRLLVAEAERIALAMCKIKLIPDLEALRARYKAESDAVYHATVPAELLPVISKYGVWFHNASDMKVRAPNGAQTTVTFHKADDLQYTANNSYWNHWYASDHRPMKPFNRHEDIPVLISQDQFDMLDTLSSEMVELTSKIKNTRTTIVQKLRGRSVKTVCSQWPEAKDVIEKMTFSDDYTRRVPMMVSPELNNILGLPPSAETVDQIEA